MTHPHDDPTPVDHDPTGMRDLLAALPDPGPMPEDLVARITAALAEESRSGEAGQPSDAGTLVALRPRRSGLRHLGVAAAVVAAVGLGGVALSAGPDSLTTQFDAFSRSSEQADAEAGAAADGDKSPQGASGVEGGGTDAGAPLAPDPGPAQVVIIMSGTNHDSSSLATSARSLGASDEAVIPLAAESPGIGPIATPIGARSCADALGVSASAGILVDVSQVDGSPAAILVVLDGSGRTAYAVARSCTAGSPGLIAGPVPVT